MIRISKLTDYALVILAFMCTEGEQSHQASDISSNTKIALPTTAKILKQLSKAELLTSQRGVNGGYSLAKKPETISVADVIQALEGPLSIMDCAIDKNNCAIYSNCQINAPWAKINAIIEDALSNCKVIDLIK